jgi:hypothetical protein
MSLALEFLGYAKGTIDNSTREFFQADGGTLYFVHPPMLSIHRSSGGRVVYQEAAIGLAKDNIRADCG